MTGFQGIYYVADFSEMKRELLARTHRHLSSYVYHKTANSDVQFVCRHVFNISVFAYVTKKPLPDVQLVLYRSDYVFRSLG